MGILAKDEGLAAVGRQPFPDPGHGGVHLAVHIRGLRIPRIPVLAHALVVHQPGLVQPAHLVAHLQDHPAAEALVAAAPDQDAGMVLVPLHHALNPVQHHRQVFHPVPGQALRQRQPSPVDHIPNAVGLHVAFVDHIQPQLVAQVVQHAAVRIVAGADGVQVVPLHGDQVPPQMLRLHGPAALRAEIVPVRALEHDPLSVDQHEAVLHLKPAESDLLADPLTDRPLRPHDPDLQVIEVGNLRAPFPGIAHRQRRGNRAASDFGLASRQHGLPVRQPDFRPAALGGLRLQLHLQHRVPVFLIQHRPNLQVLQMGPGDPLHINVPEDPAEAHKVLILQPAADAPPVHPAGQLVFPGFQIRRDIEFVRREAVRGETDVPAVHPQGHAALRSLEAEDHPIPRPFRGQGEIPGVAGHRIEPDGRLPDADLLRPVPGILGVGILGMAVSFHLDMSRHGNLRPAAAVVFRAFKPGNHLPLVPGVKEIPGPVQAHPQVLAPAALRRMVGVGVQPVLPEISRILQFLERKAHLSQILLLLFCLPAPAAQAFSVNTERRTLCAMSRGSVPPLRLI